MQRETNAVKPCAFLSRTKTTHGTPCHTVTRLAMLHEITTFYEKLQRPYYQIMLCTTSNVYLFKVFFPRLELI